MSNCIDIGDLYSGASSVAMNTSCNRGGFLRPVIAAYGVEKCGDWSRPFDVLAGLYLMAAVCLIVVRADRPLQLQAEQAGVCAEV